MNMTLTSRDGRAVPIAQVGTAVVREEDPILKRRDRLPTITVQCDIDDALQPPAVTMELAKLFKPITDHLPAGYSVEIGANVEEAAKANTALAAVIPIMIVCMLVVIIFQVRSLSALAMTVLTAPLGLVGVVPILLIFHQPFGFDAILGLIALAGILMRNTLILIGQIGGGNSPAFQTGCADGTGRGPGLHPTHVLGILGIARLYTDRRNGCGNSPDADISSSTLFDLVSRQAHKRWAAHTGDPHSLKEHSDFT